MTVWKKQTDGLLYLSRLTTAVILLGGLALSAWAQFIGPGFWQVLRNNLGITELNQRVSLLEQIMPPPLVVDWPNGLSYQVGDCHPASVCLYSLVGARTEYGEHCGTPTSVTPEIVAVNGDSRPTQTRYHSSFQPIELDRQERRFEVPIVVPRLPPGQYLWRARTLYPDCPGRREPIPRVTPWWPLFISPPPERQSP